MLRLIILALVWGSSFLWIKLSLRGFSPTEVVLARLAFGAASLLAVCWIRKMQLPHTPKQWGHLAVAAVFANSVPYLLFAVGEQRVDSSLAGVLNATAPLWTITLALSFRQERELSPLRGIGLAIGFTGAVVTLAPWQAAADLPGALACLAAAACYGVAYVYTKRFLSGWDINPIAMVATQLVAATVLIAAFAVPVFGAPAVEMRADAVVALVVLGVFGTGFAYVLNYKLTVDDGSTAASTVTYLIPVVAVLLGTTVLAEPLRWNAVIGTILALIGVTLARHQPATRPGGADHPPVAAAEQDQIHDRLRT